MTCRRFLGKIGKRIKCNLEFLFIMMMIRASDITRAYPVSDVRRPRLTSVRNGQGLPGFGRSRLKKLVRVRVGTLNVGSMTGRGRELADLMERRKV